jgi:hypothetical protein
MLSSYLYCYVQKIVLNGHYIAPLSLQPQASETMKIKCVKFECDVCGNLASIQVFYNMSGEIKYASAMHYRGRQDCKSQFDSHQQSLEYIQRKLNQIPKMLITK